MRLPEDKFPYIIRIPPNLINHGESRILWCTQNVGRINTDWDAEVFEDFFVYYFMSEADALMFKLRFGCR